MAAVRSIAQKRIACVASRLKLLIAVSIRGPVPTVITSLVSLTTETTVQTIAETAAQITEMTSVAMFPEATNAASSHPAFHVRRATKMVATRVSALARSIAVTPIGVNRTRMITALGTATNRKATKI